MRAGPFTFADNGDITLDMGVYVLSEKIMFKRKVKSLIVGVLCSPKPLPISKQREWLKQGKQATLRVSK